MHRADGIAAARGLGAIALSALLLAAADPAWLALWPLAWFAFLPWLRSLDRLRPVPAGVSGLLMGLAFALPLRWSTFAAGIAAGGETGAPGFAWTLALFSLYGLPFALFAWIDAAVLRPRLERSRWSAPLRAGVLAGLVCSLWVPFPFTPASLLASVPRSIQLAELGGEPLLLWLMLWPSMALAEAARHSAPATGAKVLLQIVAVLGLVHGYGAVRLHAMDRIRPGDDPITLAVLPMQFDLPAHAGIESLSRDRTGASGSALERSRRGLERAPQCELVVWPETPLSAARSERACQLAQGWAEGLGRPLLLQCARQDEGSMRWTAELFRPGQDTPTWHAKSALLPLYERSPWSASRVVAGRPGSIFPLDQSRTLVPALCFELHSRPHLRHARLDGGRIVIHMASFAPFARHRVDHWDLAMAQIRAVEFRMPIVRAANRGPVGWIDAGGRVQASSAPFGQAAPCLDTATPRLAPPPHAWIAPVAPLLPALPAVLFLWPGSGRRKSPRRAPRS